MNKKSFLYSAAFIGLAAASGTIPQARAQKGIALQPATQWAVNKVATEGGNGYCAVAQRFRPSTILTFARNNAEEASFALDFQSAKFRQAEPMEVILDPGAGQQRGFEVYPVSNQAFVIRLGQDGAFFNALDKTGYLRVEFGGSSYNFDLSDVSAGQAKLASCLNEAPVQADDGEDFGGQTASASNFRSGPSSGSVEREIEEMKRQLAKLQSDNERLAVTAGKNDASDTGSVVSDQLLKQVSALEQENLDLRARLKNGNENIAGALRSNKDVDAIARLSKENQDLRTALETAQAEDIQEAVLHDQLAELQTENEKLRGEIKQADASGVSSDDVLKVIKENERLKEELAHKSTDISQIQSLREKITALEQENSALKTSKAASAGDPAALEESLRQIEALKEENKRLQKVVKSSEVTGDAGVIVRELKGQIGKLSEEAAAREQKLKEYSKLAGEVQLLRTTNEQLEQQLIESALRGPVNDKILTQKIVALETQNDSLLQKIQSEADTATEGDEQVLDALKAENEELKKKITDGATTNEGTRKLQAELETLRKENDELKAGAAASSSGDDLAAQLQKALDDNKTLQAQLQQKGAELAELSSLREEVERLRAENEQLKAGQPTAAQETDPMAANPEVETLHRENETLRSQIAGMGDKDSEIADLKAKLKEQENKIAAAEEATKKANAEAAAGKKAAEEKRLAEARVAQERADKIRADEMRAAEEAAAKAPRSEQEAKRATQVAEQKRVAKAQDPELKAADVASDAAPGMAIDPRPLRSAPAIEEEMIRLEHKLSEAKAGGDQMAIQQAARDYINLKGKLSAAQELSAATSAPVDVVPEVPAAKGGGAADALLAYAGTGKAPVGDVRAEPVAGGNALADDPRSGALLNAGAQAKSASNGMSAEMVNEAQRQEQKMSLRKSEDPFADIKIEDEFTGFEAAADGSVKEAGVKAQAPEATGREYRGRINEARVVTQDSVREANARAQELMETGSATPATADWGQTTKGEVKSSGGGVYKPGVGIPQLLGKADVVSPQAVSVVSSASGAGKLAYQWKADKLFGSAVQTPLSDPSRFDGEVRAYLEQTKQRCGKDFAVVPDEETSAGDKRIATYEIACVGQGVSSSASLIFFSQQGTFTVLAHEAPADQLEDAMKIRDRLVKAISGS